MTKRLIVNADDYGHTPGVSAGIRKAHHDGIVTTTTVMMNYPDALDAIERALADCPRLGIGVHLIMTEGGPLLPPDQVPSMVGPDGLFHANTLHHDGQVSIDIDDLRAEWHAQIEKFLAAGATIDHLDSHHHIACRSAQSLQVLSELATEYNVPVRHPYAYLNRYPYDGQPEDDEDRAVMAFADPMIGRVRSTDRYIGQLYNRAFTVESVLEALDSIPTGSSAEMMVHPGFVDDDLMRMSTYNTMRQTELDVLTDARVLARVRERGIDLIRFADL